MHVCMYVRMFARMFVRVCVRAYVCPDNIHREGVGEDVRLAISHVAVGVVVTLFEVTEINIFGAS